MAEATWKFERASLARMYTPSITPAPMSQQFIIGCDLVWGLRSNCSQNQIFATNAIWETKEPNIMVSDWAQWSW